MGREFIELFDEWSSSYDETVAGGEVEYKEVFHNYEHILETVVNRSGKTVLEFGVGTGNLSEKLLSKGKTVIGIEPSKGMREKALKRNPQLELHDGDFLSFPKLDKEIDTIVSTYAFHHLTDDEKDTAIRHYSQLLKKDGKIVFADTAFLHESEKIERHEKVKKQGYLNLLKDLQTEYYTTLEVLDDIFKKHDFEVSFEKLNEYVWLMEAVKK
ncbi:class I SAM-dependent DNA methyltransferase [Fictibacillus phosphorivorans]|uniref:class I SAM-dependent DNA methyltransferase n=1 Tax=Fictibacillus phosphorivorans TaxID=1221500 RepID=UPI002041AEF4|nr:class I SAM-dependent methyltransferase [Fictibacillus phosphorivorans]MCM3716952.1 class I SAM-dependent methyltransferase [Fictibacillus phosphorivorans]MCM3774499.1 class I SAM-dependent methyltransferase [Fictibacillus phosphorivorans]